MKYVLAILLVYVIYVNYSGHQSSTASNSNEISTRDARPKFISALAIEDQAAAEEIYNILEQGINTWLNKSYSEARQVKKMIAELGVDTSAISENETIDIIASSDFKDENSPIRASIAKSYIILKSSINNVSDYEVKKRLVHALRSTWDKKVISKFFKFPPELQLKPVSNSPALPDEDTKFVNLSSVSAYHSDQYFELFKLKASNLPVGAIDPLFHLMNAPLSTADRRDLAGNDPRMLIRKYRSRACPVAIDFLVNPQKYGSKTSNSRDLEYAAYCPGELRKQVFKAALMSGWNDAELYLRTEEEWANEILNQFNDSPYGKPGAFSGKTSTK